MGKMSEGQLGSYAESDSGRSSQGSTWRERRQKRREDKEHEQEEKQSGLGKGSFQTHRIMLGVSGRECFDRKDEELERLHRLVSDLELEVRGRRQRRDREEPEKGLASVGGRYGEGSHRYSSHRHWDRSREYVDRDLIALEE